MAQRCWAAQVGGGDWIGCVHAQKVEKLINLVENVIVTQKSVVGQQKSSKQMIMGGNKCGPAQQGLAHAFDNDAAAGCMQWHPIQ